ncbi:MAG: glycosyltransferase family 61 protein [Rhodocyclaceae bacterium]|nr:glycosyltransferase family 61 protein [Rhodocyclaceae bacterium]
MNLIASILRLLKPLAPYPFSQRPEKRWPLCDVREYAETRGTILKSGGDIHTLMETFGPVLQDDLDWKSSLCYPAPYIAELNGVWVLPGSKILLSPDGRALSDEIEFAFRMFGLRPKLWNMDITEGPCLNIESAPHEPTIIPAGIHLTCEHEANYFHWIVEVLPRLFLCEKMLTDKQVPILVSEGLHENLYALLNIIRSSERPVLVLKKDYYYSVASLIYPSDLTRILDTYDRAPGNDTTYLPVALLRAMKTEIKNTINARTSHFGNRIYIKRNSSYRRLLNEPEIEELLSEHGFDTVDTGELTIEEQIGIFAHCELIVGPSGAALTNMLWCCPETRVVILHSDHPFKKYPYWNALARACELRITYLAGPRAHNITDMFEAHDDFSINPEELRQVLLVMAEVS